MTVVILVAGRGTRFRDDKPKCLVDVNGITLLEWTISLIRKVDSKMPINLVTGHRAELISEYLRDSNYDNLKLIHNLDYENDQNILSAYAGIENVEGNVLVIEGDCIFNQSAMKEMVEKIGNNKNIIFTQGSVNTNSNNAIIKSDKDGKFMRYLIGERDFENTENWSNMAGSVIFRKEDKKRIMNWLNDYEMNPKTSYYFQPLVNNSEIFYPEVVKLDSNSSFLTFNTQVEYLNAMNQLGIETSIKLVKVDSLRHVEGFSQKRVKWLKDKIINEGVWNRPICIDSENGIVMDGQHRMEVAKSMGLTFIPAMMFSHNDVDFWSLRENHEVTLDLILSKSLSGNPYPYKTVKYSFPLDIPSCRISLEEL